MCSSAGCVTIAAGESPLTDHEQRLRGEIEHLRHRERDLIARLEVAKERLVFFPNPMTEHEVAALAAEHDGLTQQLNNALRALNEP